MWKEFYKDGEVKSFETNHFYHGVHDVETKLIKAGWLPVFDDRKLWRYNGQNGTILVANTTDVKGFCIRDLKEEISKNSSKSTIHTVVDDLDESNFPAITDLVEKGKVKNVLVEGNFGDIEDFRSIINNLLCNFLELNYFVISGDKLLSVLQDEVANHMDKYKIRNSYYTYGGPKKISYFNELTFTLLKNSVYEFDPVNLVAKRIKFAAGYDKLKVSYEGEYKFMIGDYRSEKSALLPNGDVAEYNY